MAKGLDTDLENLGIRATIYDFLAYFLSGMMFWFLALLFSANADICSFYTINSIYAKVNRGIPNWIIIITMILIIYSSGLLISTMSSLLVENLFAKNLKYFKIKMSIKGIVSTDLYNHFLKKTASEYGFALTDKDNRLLITKVEKQNQNSYNTAFVFLTLYAINRNLCLLFLVFGIINITSSIITKRNYWIIGLIFAVLAIITFIGYYRFFRYFLNQIVSAYMNIKDKEGITYVKSARHKTNMGR